MTEHPNIIFVLTDQMRSTAMGCSGVEKVITPNLDKLADEGTRFTNAIANSPACTPSRANLLTGMHTLSHGLINNDMELGTNFRGFAHCLNDAGYKCGYIGKWHLGDSDRGAFIPPGPKRQGFDDYWAVSECNHNYYAGYVYINDNPEPVWLDGYEPEGQTELAINYIKEKSVSDNPFCLFLSWGPPHCPYEMVPEKYRDKYPVEKIELLPNAVDSDVQSIESVGKISEPAAMTNEQRDKRKKEIIAGYYAHITAMDELFGRISDAVKEAGIDENTIVIFSSDHGDMLFSQNRGWKSKPWREAVGIPLIMKSPGKIPAGRVTNKPISMVDLMPTILSLAGIDFPADVEGVNLSDFVGGNENAAHESVFINFLCLPEYCSCNEWRGVVTEFNTYVRLRDKPWLLYDDNNDPFQLNNLVNTHDHENIQNDLESKLSEWMKMTNDAFETSETLADKLCPGHIDNVVPIICNEKIAEGQKVRMKLLC